MTSPTQSATSSPTQPPPPIKGSWEQLIEEAFQLDENRNADALLIYDKLITRLRKMPDAKRKDHGERLQRILEASCYRSANLNCSLERYDEALKNFESLYEVVPADENKVFVLQAQIRTMQMMDRPDDAIAMTRVLPIGEKDPLGKLIQEFGINLDVLRFDEAESILNTIKETIDSDAHHAVRSEEELARDTAQAYSMSAILALELHEWERGISEFREAKEQNSELSQEGDYLLYSNLVHRGQPELALPIIADEPVAPRRKYWQGLGLFGLGKIDEANAVWEEVISTEIDEKESEAYIDIVLTHLYLGDKKQVGLQMLLSMLDEIEKPSWQLLFFAAVGWALRNNATNTKVNLEHSIDQFRRQSIGSHLPWTLWPPVRDLLNDEMQATMKPYFKARDLHHYFGI